MGHAPLGQRIASYDAWKTELTETLNSCRDWLETQGLGSAETDLRLRETANALRKDRLTIACVAEFSRGKTELINAIFFADCGRRLLPSQAGRTTMCPTELFHDRDSGDAYIRLLPMETRSEGQSIAALREKPEAWEYRPLALDSPDAMAASLAEVTRTRRLSADAARALGFHIDDAELDNQGEVEIPLWRHALISYPHPLLKQGLVVLDTPGLNALGAEPELTLSMLPAAQAVLFLLAADSGVTRSDLDTWQQHIHAQIDTRHGIAVALNKIDTLWDELQTPAVVDAGIERQRLAAAQALDVPRDVVFPLSAHKALLGRVRGDAQLVKRSRLQELEQHLAEVILPNRQAILHEHILTEVGEPLENARLTLQGQRDTLQQHHDELLSLRGRNADVLQRLIEKSRTEQDSYARSRESFQASRGVLEQQARIMLESLDLQTLDALIEDARKSMTGSWTTAGLRRGMQALFDGLEFAMTQASYQAEETRRLIHATYHKFKEQHGLSEIIPPSFSMVVQRRELQRLAHEAEVFRNSPVTAMTGQSAAIRYFFDALVSHARRLFERLYRKARQWLGSALDPLEIQIERHREAMDNRHATLQRISVSRDTLDRRISVLEQRLQPLTEALHNLHQLQASLRQPPQQAHGMSPSHARPALASA